MEKYIYNEQNGLWYELKGDYYIPCLTIPKEEQQPSACGGVGIFGIFVSIAKGCMTVCFSAGSSTATLPS